MNFIHVSKKVLVQNQACKLFVEILRLKYPVVNVEKDVTTSEDLTSLAFKDKPMSEKPSSFGPENEPSWSFPWSDIAITESEYEEFLSKIEDIDICHSVKHSPSLNEVRVKLNSWSTAPLNELLSEYPDVKINHIHRENTGLIVNLRTTHWFMSDEEIEELRGEFTIKGMFFIKEEFKLLPKVTEAQLEEHDIIENSTISVSAKNIGSFGYFSEISDSANLYVKEAELTHDGNASITFAWNGESSINSEFINHYNQSKRLSFARAVFRSSPPLVCEECGSECHPKTMMISDSRDKMLDSFEVQQKLPDSYPYQVELIRVPLKSQTESSVLRELRRTPENSETNSEGEGIPMSLPFGYYCEECEVLLRPKSHEEVNMLLHNFTPSIDCYTTDYEYDGEVYHVLQYDVPYLNWNTVDEPLPRVQKEVEEFKERVLD